MVVTFLNNKVLINAYIKVVLSTYRGEEEMCNLEQEDKEHLIS